MQQFEIWQRDAQYLVVGGFYMLDQCLCVPRSFGIFHDRFGAKLRGNVTVNSLWIEGTGLEFGGRCTKADY